MKKLIRLAGLMFCAVIIAAGAWIATDEAQAMTTTSTPKPDYDWYEPDRANKNGPGIGTRKFLKETIPEVKAIGEVFVHGGNGRVDKVTVSSLFGKTQIGKPVTVKCYVDDYDDRGNVTIQGHKIDPGWIICENFQHLWNLAHAPKPGVVQNQDSVDAAVGWTGMDADDQEFCAVEGEKFEVVDYDDKWVYFWTDGTKSYSNSAMSDCSGWLLMNSHPAGFYRIARSNVWFHLYEEDKYVSKNAQYAAIGYATTNSLDMYQEPGKIKAKVVYQVGQNSKIRVVDAAPVESIVPGDDTLYYKIMFVGSNDTYYMGYNYYSLYVDSRYINLHPCDRKGNIIEPEGTANARIADVEKSSYVVYSKKSTSSPKVNTLMREGAKVFVDQANTDDEWAAIYVNNRLGYIPAKNLKYYIDEVKILDIVDNQYVLSWGNIPAKVSAEFYDAYRGTKLTTADFAASVDSVNVASDIVKSDNPYNSLTVQMVAKTEGTDDKAKVYLKFPAKVDTPYIKYTTNTRVYVNGINEGAELQYSTNSNFKNAKSVTAKDNYVIVNKLKKNTKYYFRYRNNVSVKTVNGTKTLHGEWSKAVNAKTTNLTMATPKIKSVTGIKNGVRVTWAKYTGKAHFHEIYVATDKNFTKNVKMGGKTKSGTVTEIHGLKAKTKYYIRMRTTYEEHGEDYYSKWTTVRSFKTK